MATITLNVGNFHALQLNSSNYPLWSVRLIGLAESQDRIEHLLSVDSAPPKFENNLDVGK